MSLEVEFVRQTPFYCRLANEASLYFIFDATETIRMIGQLSNHYTVVGSRSGRSKGWTRCQEERGVRTDGGTGICSLGGNADPGLVGVKDRQSSVTGGGRRDSLPCRPRYVLEAGSGAAASRLAQGGD